MSKLILIFCMLASLGCATKSHDTRKFKIWVGLDLDKVPKEEFIVFSTLNWSKTHTIYRLQINVRNINFYKIYEKFTSASQIKTSPLDCCYLVMEIWKNNEVMENLIVQHPRLSISIVRNDKIGMGIESLELTSLFYRTLRKEIEEYELDFSSLNLTESEKQKVRSDFEDYKDISLSVPDEDESVLANAQKIRKKGKLRKLKVLFDEP